jgi:hypothetical protein
MSHYSSEIEIEGDTSAQRKCYISDLNQTLRKPVVLAELRLVPMA